MERVPVLLALTCYQTPPLSSPAANRNMTRYVARSCGTVKMHRDRSGKLQTRYHLPAKTDDDLEKRLVQAFGMLGLAPIEAELLAWSWMQAPHNCSNAVASCRPSDLCASCSLRYPFIRRPRGSPRDANGRALIRCVNGTLLSANSKARRAAALELELDAAHSCRDDDCDASSDSESDSEVSDAAAGSKQSGRGKRAGASQGPKKRRRLHP